MKIGVIFCILGVDLINGMCQDVDPKLKIVNTEYGPVQGIKKQTILGRDYFSFQSIPYMKPPLGKLRFRDPEPPEGWSKPLDATKEPPAYTQIDSIYTQSVVGQEDAGVINVYTSSLEAFPCFPVIVWIHGGSFREGSSQTKFYGPDFLLQKNVIVVTFNYRLGAIGFLSLNDPKLNVPGNAGLKDQNFALKWVQRNIRNFGGDPENVTLVGESAGGASVHLHMISEMSRETFKRAILFSGVAFDPWAFPQIDKVAERISSAMGFNGTTEADILEFLESTNASDIIAASKSILTSEEKEAKIVEVSIGPVVEPMWSENPFLTKDLVVAARTAWSSNIDVIMAVNSFEGLILAYKEWAENIDLVIDAFNNNTGYFALLDIVRLDPSSPQAKVFGQQIKNLYFDDSAPLTRENLNSFYKFISDYAFNHGNYRAVQSRLKYGNGKTYMSRFEGDTELNFIKRNLAKKPEVPGATHADDVFYYFKTEFTPILKVPSLEIKLIQTMVDLITSFAINGKPTKSFEAIWDPISKCDEIPMVLNIDNDGERMIPLPEYDRLKIFNEILKEANIDLI